MAMLNNQRVSHCNIHQLVQDFALPSTRQPWHVEHRHAEGQIATLDDEGRLWPRSCGPNRGPIFGADGTAIIASYRHNLNVHVFWLVVEPYLPLVGKILLMMMVN